MTRTAKKAGRREADLGARFTSNEKVRVELAMARTGKNLTDFVREAVLRSADQVLENDPLAAFASALGIIDVRGDFGRQAEAYYTATVLAKHDPSGRRTSRSRRDSSDGGSTQDSR